MKTASDELKEYLLTAKQLYMADLYTFVLKDGTTLRYTSLDREITYNSNVFTKINLERSTTKIVKGLEIDVLSLSIYPNDDLIGTRNFIYAAINGFLDGASFLLERIFFTSWEGSAIDTVILFGGQVSSIEVDRTQVIIKIKSHIESFNVSLPRRLYIPGCQNTLYDSICGLDKDDFKYTGEIIGSSSTKQILYCDLANDERHFDLGFLTFTSGDNINLSRTIRIYYVGIIHLIFPLENLPEPGDTFIIYPGCDKRKTSCDEKFDNLSNFRGFPYIPEQEVVMYGGAGRAPSNIMSKK